MKICSLLAVVLGVGVTISSIGTPAETGAAIATLAAVLLAVSAWNRRAA